MTDRGWTEVDSVVRQADLLRVGLRRAVGEVTDPATLAARRQEILDALRILIKADRGITCPISMAVCVGEWIDQARHEDYDGDWLRRCCMAIDGGFENVVRDYYQAAIDGLYAPGQRRTRGPKPTVRLGCHLTVLAELHMDIDALHQEARNMRFKSRRS